MSVPAVQPAFDESRLFTVEEYIAECPQKWTELLNGKVVEVVPNTFRQGEVIGELIFFLKGFVDKEKIGTVYGRCGCVLTRNPDTVLGPRLSFLDNKREKAQPNEDDFIIGAPTLAIEVITGRENQAKIEMRTNLYLENGSKAVWLVDAGADTVTVRHPGGIAQFLTKGDTLSGGDILPGFEVRVRELFE